MLLSRYARIWRIPGVSTILLLSLVLRIPQMAMMILLTLHVVDHLGRSWTAAGVLAAVATIALAISQPWRGRLLDRVALRPVIATSITVTALCWSIAPFMSYWWLMLLVAIAGLFAVPANSIVRQVLIAAVPISQRRQTLALEGVFVEFAFIVGPLSAIWVSTVIGTTWTLLAVQVVGLLGGLALYRINPPLVNAPVTSELPSELGLPLAPAQPHTGFMSAMTGRFGVILVLTAASVAVVMGSEVGLTAALRELDALTELGQVLALWGLGSVIGGLVYGALPRAISPRCCCSGWGLSPCPWRLARRRFNSPFLPLSRGSCALHLSLRPWMP
ncbi:MFS transporter [Ornithinimicrobium sp. INDO-MA30-4]|uniref:MFS transporter n=1 Tax=Ornithinimicrobium sp. INDO-MA30-4 TaxID=2908651 RepID=UPI001F177D1D|nr:MFS transporter [Ornithinimicrobium sp. INDO-MA30-4]UJH70964.1 MFS transporter [Ornithinimicrobium sp. INDO-MA30-4]